MPCYVMYDDKRNPVGHICGKLGKHCSDCGDLGENLCDYPVGKNKTCDRSICEFHSHEIAPDIHYCDSHYSEWLAFVEAGGVKGVFENVVPFSGYKKTMKPFAKLFEYDDIGQVLVMIDTNDDGDPCVSHYFSPDGLGVCQLSSSFEDSERGWESAERRFEMIDADSARETALNALPEEIGEALAS